MSEPEFKYTAEQIVECYIALRDKLKEVKAKHKQELEPFITAMTALEGEAHRMMTHLKSTLSTNAGSCFWVPQSSYKVVNVQEFQSWVQRQNQWQCLTAHVSKEGIEIWRDQQKRPLDWPADVEWNPPVPPGVEYDYHLDVQFRKG
jgi:hypothetical protein